MKDRRLPDDQRTRIEASIRQAEEMLTALNLSDEERAWSKAIATHAFKAVTDSFLDGGKFGPLRAVSVPAALAFAMVMARDWAADSDKLE